MIASLSPYTPDQLASVDRLDEQANSRLLRAGIRPGPDGDTAAMVIFRWLLHMTSGKPGSVAGVTAAALAKVTQGKEQAAREAIKLLDQRGLVQLAPIGSEERPKRNSPYVIHVLEPAAMPAQRTFEFAERPQPKETVLRVIHAPTTNQGSTAAPAELCAKGFVQSFVQSPLHKAEITPEASKSSGDETAEVVAGECVYAGVASEQSVDELPLAQQLRRGRDIPHTKTNSSKIHTHTNTQCVYPPVRRESRGEGSLSPPVGIGESLVEAMLERGLRTYEQNTAGIEQLERDVIAMLPDRSTRKFRCPSDKKLRHICQLAVTGGPVDGHPPFGPDEVLAKVSMARANSNGSDGGWALFFWHCRRELRELRGFNWPFKDTKKGGA